MREIKFRCKRVDADGWAFGSLMKWGDGTCEIIVLTGKWDADKISVIPETVGQFTGLKDHAGSELYDGDILESVIDKMLLKWVVIYKNGCFGIRNIGIDGYTNHAEFFPIDSLYYFSDRIVCGTIHD